MNLAFSEPSVNSIPPRTAATVYAVQHSAARDRSQGPATINCRAGNTLPRRQKQNCVHQERLSLTCRARKSTVKVGPYRLTAVHLTSASLWFFSVLFFRRSVSHAVSITRRGSNPTLSPTRHLLQSILESSGVLLMLIFHLFSN